MDGKRPKVHARVDRLTIDNWIREKGWLYKDFAVALEKEIRRKRPYSLGTISHKLTGVRKVSPTEISGISRIVERPLSDVMSAFGVTDPVAEVGTVDARGNASGPVKPEGKRQTLVFKTEDAWNGARVSTRVATFIGRGLYLLRHNGSTVLRQCFGTPGGVAILASMFGDQAVEHVPVSEIEWQARVTAINFR